MHGGLFAIGLVINLIVLAATVKVAIDKQRNPVIWGLLAFVFSFVVLVILIFMPPVQDGANHEAGD